MATTMDSVTREQIEQLAREAGEAARKNGVEVRLIREVSSTYPEQDFGQASLLRA